MKRVWIYTSAAIIWSVAVGSVQADDWRPVEPRPAAALSLGKPAQARTPIATTANRTDPQVIPAGLSSISVVDVQPTSLVVRGQSPDGGPRPIYGGAHPPAAIPGSPEEQYNCGVVSEGPPGGGLFSGVTSHPWLSGIGNIFGLYTNFLSDHAFDGFVSPITNPFYFEDPRSLTELRPVFIYQRSPGSNPALSSANTEMFSLQARLALTDRWSLTLNKLGFTAVQSDGTVDGSGLSELNFGIKYTFWRDDACNKLMAFGLQAELPIGASDIGQGTGDASLTPYFSYAQEFAHCWHVMAATGYRFRLDSERSDAFFVSAHLDYSIYSRIYPMLEMTWWHSMKSGPNLPGGFEGQDLFNFGNANSSGKDIVTLAAGVRFKITEAAQFGVAFEFPVMDDHDIMDWRITADFILRY